MDIITTSIVIKLKTSLNLDFYLLLGDPNRLLKHYIKNIGKEW